MCGNTVQVIDFGPTKFNIGHRFEDDKSTTKVILGKEGVQLVLLLLFKLMRQNETHS